MARLSERPVSAIPWLRRRAFLCSFLALCAVLVAGCPSPESSSEQGRTAALNQPSPFGTELSRTHQTAPRNTSWTELRELAIGERFICGVSSGGMVYCWGSERYGELGLGPPQESEFALPQGPLRGMGSVRVLRANRGFACGLSRDARVYCWGNNYYSQLGDGTAQNRATPVLVEGLPSVRDIAVGGTHACALTEAATVYCWGDNRDRQLGQKLPEKVLEPSLLSGLGTVERIALGNRSSCFLRRNGSVVCLGSNQFGELGRGVGGDELASSGEVAAVTGLPPLVDLQGYAEHFCGLTADASVYCWGGRKPPSPRELRIRERRMAGGLSVEPLPRLGVAEKISGLDGVVAVTVGLGFTCALRDDGQVYCWGENGYGQLGSGSQSNREDPSPVAGIRDATEVWAGSRNACARESGSQVWCWGDNQGGQIGNGGFVTTLVPTPVMRPSR